MSDCLHDGFIEDLGNGKVRVWKDNGNGGGFWSTMSKMRLDKDFVENKVPSRCPVCHRPMIIDVDKGYYFRHKCCFSCYIYFVEGREDDWDKDNLKQMTDEEVIVYDKWRDKK
jgi:hypothetical protein